ncbi:hypothetical protein B0F90DRAFT_1746763 [Multifurca ochricompacta]|uniref:Transmembrane protein n=1 Tax=Multifurca ochricompacta TaxID=376703 RepID=A0AAD4LZX4_9AGAM|nr:hypothetical protein B0F90DRAFT_1746763 [Multifurca ochricompacta]
MLSFTKVITLAAVAFGALTQAVPLAQRETGIQARVPGDVSPASHPTIVSVFADLTVDLDVELCALTHVTRENSTVVDVEPIVVKVDAILKKAVVAVEALVDISAEDSCKDKDGVLVNIEVLVAVIVDVVLAVVVALKAVLVVCVDLKAVVAILARVVVTLLVLIRAVLKICVEVYGEEIAVRVQAFLGAGICAYVFAAVNVAISL